MKEKSGEPARPGGLPRPSLAASMLVATGVALATGGILHLAGAGGAGDVAWAASGGLGLAYAVGAVAASLRHGRLGVDVIAVAALAGALWVGELLAGAVVSVMLATGRTLETWAAGRARRDLAALLARAPRTARRLSGGTIEVVDLDQVAVGDLITVGPGEVVPVDGTVTSHAAVFDESALTGEPLPVERPVGDVVRSGVVNAGAAVDIRAVTAAAESTYAGIVRMVAEAEAVPAPFVRLADRWAGWFLAVTALATTVAFWQGGAPRAVAVLVVATPCPLILAVPVAVVAGLSRSARRGVVMKGGPVLERLAGCTTALLDKTGTITTGRPALSTVVARPGLDPDEALRLAASVDQVSPHVLARAVVSAAYGRGLVPEPPGWADETPGQGIRGSVGGTEVAVGRAAWVGMDPLPDWARNARRTARREGAMTVFVATGGEPAAMLVLEDRVRPDARRTLAALRSAGIDRIVMATGDRGEVARMVGEVVGVDEVLSEQTPAEKLHALEVERRRAPTMMVGDGINDAPALAAADVGVAVSGGNATASSEAADVVLTVERVDRLGEAVQLARRTRRIARQSVVAGMGMSLAAMVAAGAGYLPAVAGAILQEAIDTAVIVNALRALRPGPAASPLDAAGSELTRRFHTEHVAIRAFLERLRRVADDLGAVPPEQSLAEVTVLQRQMVEEVLPHEAAENDVLYPVLERALGGQDPTGTMTRAHVEIAHLVRRIGDLVDDLGGAPPDAADLAELRRLCYGLHAVLALHTEQEEESYLSLGEDAAPAPEGALTPPPHRGAR